MKLIKFTVGTGIPVWINQEAISSVQSDSDPDSKLTLITTQDGKEYRVQGIPTAVVNTLQQGY
jgi:uncharacterized protein YlzI (FlbEa/FlbD family)